MMNCKHATKLMSQEKDSRLSFKQRVSLRFHMMMCSGCRNYNKQMDFIRKAMQQYKGH